MATEVGHLEQGERERKRERERVNTNDTPDESIQQVSADMHTNVEIYLQRGREVYRVYDNRTHDLIRARN